VEEHVGRDENGSVMTVDPQFFASGAQVVQPLQWPHLHSQLPIRVATNSSCETLRKSVIGKTELENGLEPAVFALAGQLAICRSGHRSASDLDQSGLDGCPEF